MQSPSLCFILYGCEAEFPDFPPLKTRATSQMKSVDACRSTLLHGISGRRGGPIGALQRIEGGMNVKVK